MEHTIRVQFYHMDGGAYRKSYIQHIDADGPGGVQFAKNGPVFIQLSKDDWYGRNLPEVIYPDQEVQYL